MKQLWMLTGGNGSGKSTFYEQMLKPKGMPFINADIIAREVFPEDPEINSRKASMIAAILRNERLREGQSFCFETVFSHPEKIDFIAEARALGYYVILVFVHLELPELNEARVSQRVSDGGHSVPREKIYTRIPRTVQNVIKALPLCNEVHVLDNSELDDPFRRVLVFKDGEARQLTETLPAWATEFLGQTGH